MGRNLVIGITGQDPVLLKIANLLSGLNIHGVDIIIRYANERDSDDSVILLYGGDNFSPVISGKDNIIQDLCHVARSSKIPCKFTKDFSEKLKIYLPHLPEEDLDGEKPTMCLENQVKFLELVLTRYIKKWFY